MPKRLGRWSRAVVALVAALALAGVVAAFEPATRYLVADQFVCFGCHVDAEYDPAAEPVVSKVHPATPGGRATWCVECHVPEGFVASLYVYTHFLGRTDLLGNYRGLERLKAGPYYPPIARKAHEVRDAMLAADSAPCRSCHVEEEIKPKRRRGQRQHEQALEEGLTCIECHYNLVHRPIEPREEFLSRD